MYEQKQNNSSSQLKLFEYQDVQDNSTSWFSDALSSLNFGQEAGWPDVFGDALRQRHFSSNKSGKVRVLSLFSGAGGLDIGFHDAGFEIVECNEIESAFAKTLSENSKDGGRLYGSNVVCQDINEYDPILENIDFIIGGPPCQTFSAAGARAAGVNGTDDDRGNLFLQYARILEKLNPQGFLFENVYRIIGAQGGKPWAAIQQAFQSLGYTLYWRILDSADFGVPQFRERLIIVGLKTKAYKFPYPSHGPDSLDNRSYYTAGQAISNLTTDQTFSPLGGRHGHLLKDIPPGLNYSFYTEKMGHPKPLFGWRSKFSDYLYKADSDTPVRTIKAQGGQYTGPFHWDSRVFTIEEFKRLQTFPDSYKIVGNRGKAIHQLGNSVPPQIARILALSILDQVFGKEVPFKLQYMPDSFQLGFRQRKRLLTKIYSSKAAKAIEQLPNIEKSSVELVKQIENVSISDDFQLITEVCNGQSQFVIEVIPNEEILTLSLCDSNLLADPVKYEFEILLNGILSSHSKISVIKMRSSSSVPSSILVLWKYLEKLIKSYFHKDDLVQLFGYYQYKQNYTIGFKLHDVEMQKHPLWKVLPKVSSGRSIGQILPVDELASFYELSVADLESGLKELKYVGFEIRNHNTNKQIKPGMLLIPYAFPSLNERSLQRFTEL